MNLGLQTLDYLSPGGVAPHRNDGVVINRHETVLSVHIGEVWNRSRVDGRAVQRSLGDAVLRVPTTRDDQADRGQEGEAGVGVLGVHGAGGCPARMDHSRSSILIDYTGSAYQESFVGWYLKQESPPPVPPQTTG